MTRRPLVMTGLVLAMLLAAIEATIVATAMPDIAAELGGFSLYGWVFSAYLLTQAVTTPVFGKLADMFGRKPVFMGGVALFLLGSALCALAPTMGWLVAARLVQGFGAGAVLPIAVTLAGDLYTLEERGRVQGYMASVWGISSIVGPLAGGLIVEHLGWPWVFWLNLPFGLVAVLMIFFFLHEERELAQPRLDLLGAVLLMTGLSALLLALTRGSWELLTCAAVTLGLFLMQERRAADPIVHLGLFRQPIIGLGNVAVLMVGFAMMGLIGFMPTFVQGVLDGSALEGGFALSAMCIGWPAASVVAGRLLPRLGPRPLVRVGSVVAFLGTLEIALLASRGALWAGLGSFLVGVGFGILNTSFLVAIQSSVQWERRGMATASNMLMRNLGNAIGAAALGGLLNHHLVGYIQASGLAGRVTLENVEDLVGHSTLDPATLSLLRGGLEGGLHQVFWAICGAVALAVVISWLLPSVRLEGSGKKDSQSVSSGA